MGKLKTEFNSIGICLSDLDLFIVKVVLPDL